MSDLDSDHRNTCVPDEWIGGPEELLLTARRVYLGKTTEVARALPDRQIRMIGAWCFLDHYGPEDVERLGGMQVWAHPHTGLQTVSWLLEGEVEHRDSLGSQAMVRPGELNIMTAGHGIVHSEISQPDKPPMLHGVQLWVALPDAVRDRDPRFDQLPRPAGSRSPRGPRKGADRRGRRGQVARDRHSPLCGAELALDAGADLALRCRRFRVRGLRGRGFSRRRGDDGRSRPADLPRATAGELRLRSAQGGRVIMLGGQPFVEDIVMWWNFIGRSHEEIVEFRTAWEHRDPRFPPVVNRAEQVMEAPPMPTIPLKPRPRRRRAE